MRYSGKLAALALVSLFVPFAAPAQEYPTKPIRLIVPWPAGGISDVIARTLGLHLSESLGHQVVVDNRAGAGGTLGVALGLKAAPDGYTLLVTDVSSHAISGALYPRLPYDVLKDIQPIALVSGSPMVLVVHPQLNIKTIQRLIEAAKARPGQLNYASSGNGAITHLAAERFKRLAGVELVHVPFKGSPPATASVVAGETTLAFSTLPSTLPHAKSGRLTMLGLSFPKRSPQLPDVPAIAEHFPGFDLGLYTGLFAPAGISPRLVERLHAETARALEQPKMKEILAVNSADAGKLTPAQSRELLAKEVREWNDIIRATGVRIE